VVQKGLDWVQSCLDWRSQIPGRRKTASAACRPIALTSGSIFDPRVRRLHASVQHIVVLPHPEEGKAQGVDDGCEMRLACASRA